MADEELREAERLWKESPGDEERVERYLALRVRSEGWPLRRILEEAMRTRKALEHLMNNPGPYGVATARQILGAKVSTRRILTWLDGEEGSNVIIHEEIRPLGEGTVDATGWVQDHPQWIREDG